MYKLVTRGNQVISWLYKDMTSPRTPSTDIRLMT